MPSIMNSINTSYCKEQRALVPMGPFRFHLSVNYGMGQNNHGKHGRGNDSASLRALAEYTQACFPLILSIEL